MGNIENINCVQEESSHRTRTLRIDDVLGYESFDGLIIPNLAVSPDHEHVAVALTAGFSKVSFSPATFLWGADRCRLSIIHILSGHRRLILGPNGAGLCSPRWSPDGKSLAALAATRDWIKLCSIDLDTGLVHLLSDQNVEFEWDRQPAFAWLNDTMIACRLMSGGHAAGGIDAASHVAQNAPRLWASAHAGKKPTASILSCAGADSVPPSGHLAVVSIAPEKDGVNLDLDARFEWTESLTGNGASEERGDEIAREMNSSKRRLWHDETASDCINLYRTSRETALLWESENGAQRSILSFNTHLNDVVVGQVRDLEYSLRNGQRTMSRCVLPPDWRLGERRPAVMFVYPGLERSSESNAHVPIEGPHFIYNAHLFAAQGYVVLEPNIPVKGVCEDLIDSLVAGVEASISAADKEGLIDKSRVHVFGQSAGGWAVMALLAKTAMFRSGISLAGISDLISLHGQIDPRFRYKKYQEEGADFSEMCKETFNIEVDPWQDSGPYLRNSPIFFAESIDAPLLLMHGDLDYISIAQSEAMFVALKRLGRHVDFVRYWGEDHCYASPANIRDAFERIIQWLRERDRH